MCATHTHAQTHKPPRGHTHMHSHTHTHARTRGHTCTHTPHPTHNIHLWHDLCAAAALQSSPKCASPSPTHHSFPPCPPQALLALPAVLHNAPMQRAQTVSRWCCLVLTSNVYTFYMHACSPRPSSPGPLRTRCCA